jgi:hypothetical protein
LYDKTAVDPYMADNGKSGLARARLQDLGVLPWLAKTWDKVSQRPTIGEFKRDLSAFIDGVANDQEQKESTWERILPVNEDM